jgi:hypothetical protein
MIVKYLVLQYLAITSYIMQDIPNGGHQMWIGIRNAGQANPYWDNATFNCAPALNLPQFKAAADLTFNGFNGGTDTVSVGPGWSTWNADGGNADLYMCELGKHKFTRY